MSTTKAGKHKHGHMAWAGIIGVAAGAVLMIYVPSLKPIANTLFLFAGFHLVGLSVLLASIYVMGGRNLGKRFASAHRTAAAQFDFWLGTCVDLWPVDRGADPGRICHCGSGCRRRPNRPAAMVGTLLAATSFAGGLTTRAARRYEAALLPAVNLLSGDDSLVLDAGCGAGRTSVALGRAFKKSNIVALDRFDSNYIEDGGRLC